MNPSNKWLSVIANVFAPLLEGVKIRPHDFRRKTENHDHVAREAPRFAA
jgi:hypothetical protein